VTLDRGTECTLPLIKNWFPLLSKNLDPMADIVGMAAAVPGTRPRSNGAPASTRKNHMV
jgi:hypothetical protein